MCAQWFNRRGSNLVTIAKETGYPVKAVAGWETRGHGGLANTVKPIVCHHTAGPEPERTASNYPSFFVVRDGRAGLPGPLAQYGIGFDGTIYVFAAGLAYHAGTGSWKGWSGNSVAIGIEAEDGGDGDWKSAQLDVYPRLVAVICQFLGVGAEWVCGHKEWSPGRKIDPAGINMNDFRSKVNWYLRNPSKIRKSAPTPTKEWWEMAIPDSELDRIAAAVWGARVADVTRPKVKGSWPTLAARSFLTWGRRDTRATYLALPELLNDQGAVTKVIREEVAKVDNADPAVVEEAFYNALKRVLREGSDEGDPA